MERGARRVIVACTHPVLSGHAIDLIENSPISQLVVTDTIPINPSKMERSSKLKVISVAPLLADAISRIHCDDSVSALFDTYW
jgi:ribose-phosphate pyrophosphokinase